MVDRAELRRLAKAATPGPWRVEGFQYQMGVMTDNHEANICLMDGYLERRDADAAFIAVASPDVVLGLLDEIDRLRDEIDRLREEAKQALVIVANVGRELGQTQHERDRLRAVEVRLKGYLENIRGNTGQDVVRRDCETALADPEVEKL